MVFVTEYGLFLAKAITVVVAILATAAGLIALSSRGQLRSRERIEVKDLSQKYRAMARALQSVILPRKEAKKIAKTEEKQRKQAQKAGAPGRPRVFVLNFHGNIRASAVSTLREEITAVLTVATPADEVMLRLESSGGLVHAYGLAASQLLRLKERNIPLTVAVDKVAASGGYLMACVAQRIIAAPFAVLGSIGVVSQLPNFHRLLKKSEIDFEQITAGEYKRTLTLFGENTEKAREKVRAEVEDTHLLFKDFVAQQRPDLDIAQVATGEHWYGSRALALKLVDELRTSDDYLLEAGKRASLFEVTYTSKHALLARLGAFAREAIAG